MFVKSNEKTSALFTVIISRIIGFHALLSLCLFIGFLFLTQSIFISNYIIGGMCALIIAIALLVDLLLLPALLLISSRKV